MGERYLIVGLGNPGTRYANTRHNIGFRCVDALADRYNLSFDKKQANALLASGHIKGKPVILAKPQTFMNLSGDAVSSLVQFYKIPTQNVMVIFDDLDLPVGMLRIRAKGGSSGQKGMKHIIERLGTQDFPRIRFGIGRPPGRMDPAAYVLQPFGSGDEQILVEETIARVIKAIEIWLESDINRAMNAQNGSGDDVARRAALEAMQLRNNQQGRPEPPNPPPPAALQSAEQDSEDSK